MIQIFSCVLLPVCQQINILEQLYLKCFEQLKTTRVRKVIQIETYRHRLREHTMSLIRNIHRCPEVVLQLFDKSDSLITKCAS